jgi:beta-xylosidase
MRRWGTAHRWCGAIGSLTGCLVVLASTGVVPVGAAAIQQPAPTTTPQAPGLRLTEVPFDEPDPFVLDVHGTYYVYDSSSQVTPQGQNIPVVHGSDGHWSKPSDAVPKLPSWAEADHLTWAPEVYKIEGRYVMYLSATVKGSSPVQHCVAVATSSTPGGPFHPMGQPIVCQRPQGGDIDAQYFVDPQGPEGPSQPYYLIWKSDNNSTKGDGIPGIWAQPVSKDGMHLRGQPTEIFQPDQPWEQQLIEAPQMALAPNGSTWLFFSAGQGFFSAQYGMGAVSCTSPLGPCSGGDAQPLITSNQQGAGPGEETYFSGRDKSDWLVYDPWHTMIADAPIRPVEVSRIGWGPNGPYVATAGTFPSP